MASPTFWLAEDGSSFRIGDTVAIDPLPFGLDRDAVGVVIGVDPTHGAPVLELVAGQRVGSRLVVWPTHVLLRLG
ncbi:hypothetical protein GCM10009662_36060 [Catellatospora coxensis]